MSITTIHHVDHAPLDPLAFHGGRFERPAPGDTFDGYALPIEGWIVGRDAPIVVFEIVVNGEILLSLTEDDPSWKFERPDVAAHYPSVAHASTSGFGTRVGLLGLPLDFEVSVQVTTVDGTPHRLGTIRGRRRALRTDFHPQLQPLLVTSLGRSGTTWLMHLLSHHPDVTMHRHFGYETRAGAYWMHLLSVLAEPADAHQSTVREGFETRRRWIGHHPFNDAEYFWHHPSLSTWFDRTYPERLAQVCQHSIEQFYLATAPADGTTSPTFFAEKHLPNHVAWLMRELYPDAREVFLLRDPRDVLCSILAFNRKRGIAGFGRASVRDDVEFVASLAHGFSTLLDHWQRRRSTSFLLRYEDLIRQPRESLTAACQYVGIDASPATIERMLDLASTFSEYQRDHRTTATAEESIGRWTRDLPPELRSVCDSELQGVLVAFGYA